MSFTFSDATTTSASPSATIPTVLFLNLTTGWFATTTRAARFKPRKIATTTTTTHRWIRCHHHHTPLLDHNRPVVVVVCFFPRDDDDDDDDDPKNRFRVLSSSLPFYGVLGEIPRRALRERRRRRRRTTGGSFEVACKQTRKKALALKMFRIINSPG